MEKNRLYNIQEAATLSGLSAHTIRAWEKRYQAVKPSRTETGKRAYQEAEIERLRILGLLVNLGSTIGQIARLSDEELATMLTKLSQSKTRFMSMKPEASAPTPFTSEELLQQLANYQIEPVAMAIAHLKNTLSAKDLVFTILHPLIKQVRQRVQNQMMKEIQLQTLYSIIRFHAAGVMIPQKERSNLRKYFIASLEHINPMDSILTALLCSHHAKNFFYSHVSLPVESMLEAAKILRSEVIILHFDDHHDPKDLLTLLQTIPENMEVWCKSPLKMNTATKARHYFFQSYQELDSLLAQSPA